MQKVLRSAVAILAAGVSVQAAAQSCVKQSPPHRVALLELYTSEGCDSCPPADKWLSGLGESGWQDKLIPLALHVDYWDQLGWKDRFASPLFTERQHGLARLGGSGVVYTPGVFLNLRELRGWNSGSRLKDAVATVNGRPAGADIRLELSPSASEIKVNAQFRLRPNGNAKQPQVFLALYESRLSSQVKAGENRGVTLKHDNVVRRWIGPIPLQEAGMVARTLPLERDWKPKDLGVAGFVQDTASGEVLQATALAACTA